MSDWLLFVYKVPNEPSARRVYVWRKLKGLGALLVQDSIWVLPMTAHTEEKLRWLAAEIQEMEGGEASLWQAQQVFTGHNKNLKQQFSEQVETVYREILEKLEADEPDLAALSKQYQQAQKLDYFHSELGEQVRELLLKKRGGNEP
jgi:hypothetical protein